MVENMLVLARLDFGDDGADLEPTHLGLVVAAAVEQHRKQHASRPVTFDDTSHDPIVDAQEGWIEQVLANYLENAEKYAGEGVPIRIELAELDSEVTLRVIDSGRGINEAQARHVFEPFYRDPDAAAHVGGAGLGLAVCQRLIQLQGGRVWALPADGGGAEFGFALPRSREQVPGEPAS
jgi:K+-sensing histidine kinase KdpD